VEEGEVTVDALFNGKLTVCQPKDGYRFSIDAVLLAGLAKTGRQDRIIDLGTGCGVVPLIVAFRNVEIQLTGIEIQPELAALASRNVQSNSLSGRVRIVEGDYREVSRLFEPGSWDVVLSNPPYRREVAGRINPNLQRAIARHELAGSVDDVFAAGKFLLRKGGRLSVIYPAQRLDHLMLVAHRHGFSAKVLTMIHSDVLGPGRLVFLECRKNGGNELYVSPPFFVYEPDGNYTQAMRAFYNE
jgi:tRNA1Val (adenine37-N6)-methyltransferase